MRDVTDGCRRRTRRHERWRDVHVRLDVRPRLRASNDGRLFRCHPLLPVYLSLHNSGFRMQGAGFSV